MYPFGHEVLLVVFESVDGFVWDFPVDGIEDPVVPAVAGLDAFLKIWAAGSETKTSGDVAGDGDSGNGYGGFGGWDKRDDLGRG